MQDDEKSDTIIEIEAPKKPEIPSKAPTLTNAAGVPIIIVDRVDPRHGPPNGITQQIRKKAALIEISITNRECKYCKSAIMGMVIKLKKKWGNMESMRMIMLSIKMGFLSIFQHEN